MCVRRARRSGVKPTRIARFDGIWIFRYEYQKQGFHGQVHRYLVPPRSKIIRDRHLHVAQNNRGQHSRNVRDSRDKKRGHRRP